MRIKRIYEEAEKSDGYRILVDRLWPRGVSREKAKLDEWAKDIAPSAALRKFFDHQPDRFEEFARRYKVELESKTDEIRRLRDLAAQQGMITLVYATRAIHHNHAKVLLAILQTR